MFASLRECFESRTECEISRIVDIKQEDWIKYFLFWTKILA
jgi:hypothetical protein